MMYSEFIELAGITEYDISFNTYTDIIEPMYMVSTLSKHDFVKLLNISAIKKNYSNVNNTAKKIVEVVHNMQYKLGHESLYTLEEELERLGKEYCELKGMQFNRLDFYVRESFYSNCGMYYGFRAKMYNKDYEFIVNGNKLEEVI